MEKNFPNGFNSWIETYFEVVSHINNTVNKEKTIAHGRMTQQGTGGLYEMAEELTDQFETINQGREWDGEFFDEIENWLTEKENNQ